MKKTKVLFVILLLALSSIAIADKEIKIFEPHQKIIDEQTFSEIKAKEILKNKRIIADAPSSEDILQLKNKGCLIKQRLKHSTSFECPENILQELKVNFREARIFHITGLESAQQIHADDVWAEGVTGAGAKVVILDTGVESSHPELSDSYLGGYDFVENDNTPQDGNGHGTHVAGIITANGLYTVDGKKATGVAPDSGFYMLKVCDASGTCYEDDMIAAMEYAVDNLDAKVMSISIGGGNFAGPECDFDSLAAKVNYVVDNGISVVVSSGNDGYYVSSPACASKAIAVGAADKNNYVQYWSNYGPSLDIVAPGVDVLSTYSCLAAGDCGSIWYAYMSGTSMAAPHVSGVIALLLNANPSLTDTEIKNALYTTADPAVSCCRRTWYGRILCSSFLCTSDIEGAGIVNAYQAYLSIKQTAEDLDGDGYNSDVDCDDTNPNVNPGATEICNTIDDNCNDLIDENLAKSCGSGVCEGTQTCTAGTWGDCLTRNSDCGVCCVCENNNDPIAIYDETQDSDCQATNCPDSCNIDPNSLTWDYADDVANECIELFSCSSYDCSYSHECSVAQCSAACDATNVCDNTECDGNDGCQGSDYYDYQDVPNNCLGDCTCETNPCGTPAISYDDPKCTGCQNDDGCNDLDNNYCNGDLIMHDEGRCVSNECVTETTTAYDCSNNNTDYCSGAEIKHNDYTCSAASCVVDSTTTIQNCDDGLYCNGQETCNNAVCVAGIPLNCNDNNECTADNCNEDINSCENMPVADDTACTGGICCAGNCEALTCSVDNNCNDNNACTIDTCNNAGTCSASCSNTEISSCINNDGCCPAGCDYTDDNDCQADVKCWSAEYAYLKRNTNQFKKFCKCAEGTYSYSSYSYAWARGTVYQYTDAGNNENWETAAASYWFPAYRVRCSDGSWYYTNQDYFYG